MSKPREALGLARESARRLAGTCDPCGFRVVLFGSPARGDADQESDLDLFMEVRGDDAKPVTEGSEAEYGGTFPGRDQVELRLAQAAESVAAVANLLRSEGFDV